MRISLNSFIQETYFILDLRRRKLLLFSSNSKIQFHVTIGARVTRNPKLQSELVNSIIIILSIITTPLSWPTFRLDHYFSPCFDSGTLWINWLLSTRVPRTSMSYIRSKNKRSSLRVSLRSPSSSAFLLSTR